VKPSANDENAVASFINKWSPSGGSELANCQPFINGLCDVLGVAKPDPALPDDRANAYVFERRVTFPAIGDAPAVPKRMDCYKRHCFVLEAKQGTDREDLPLFAHNGRRPRKGVAVRGTRAWDAAMSLARGQALRYANAIAAEDGAPPFLIVVDIGHVVELFADFSLSGRHYTHFPDANTFRIHLKDLARPEIRERLRQAWTAPMELDPSRRVAAVTRDIADRLARLAKSLEESLPAERVAAFLMRCLFTMFAEDVGLLKKNCFREKLAKWVANPAGFRPGVEELWNKMNEGGFSTAIDAQVLKFNGGLFADADALDLDSHHIKLLLDAAEADWREVEPAIFGTLLERALDERERHRLGAHYTPRAYVERLVLPTVIEPLREDWIGAKGAAIALAAKGDLKGAVREVKAFHDKLCKTTILDPACGTGNFLYVTLEHMKRLEGEVTDFLLYELHEDQRVLELDTHTVDPSQFLGIEKNERAVAIAELVLWIGYLQWHFRTRGRAMPAQPVLRNFKNIQPADALLTWEGTAVERDGDGTPRSRWDGVGTVTDPTTGRAVPDAGARVPIERYVLPRPAEWPQADFIVGNPPFIGGKDIRRTLGDGYAEALRQSYPDVPNAADFVVYWWHKAAARVRAGSTRRFGFITTNSLSQTFNQRLLAHHLAARPALSILLAIPDHPWVKPLDGADRKALRNAAAVRIAMTVGGSGRHDGRLLKVVEERRGHGDAAEVCFDEQVGRIHADLTVGADVTTTLPLKANSRLCSPGVKLHGSAFIVTPQQAERLGLGRVAGLERHIRPYLNGRDLTGVSRGAMVIDLFNLTEEDVRRRFPEVYQWILERVKPERDANNRDTYRRNWWTFGEPRRELRPALAGLSRYIATVETAKHRAFVFTDGATVPDNKLVVVAVPDLLALGILSSRIHVAWALAAGGRLGVGNDSVYVKSACFDRFPFPSPSPSHSAHIRTIAGELDTLRKQRQALHPDLTLTAMYNVLEKLKHCGMADAAERDIHDKGLVRVLKELHERLDAAVFAAYGWPAELSDAQILDRLVALNRQRAEEERRGLVRWLRAEFQAPAAAAAVHERMAEVPLAAARHRPERPAWPKVPWEQVRAVQTGLSRLSCPADPASIARGFKGARTERVVEVLAALEVMGHIRRHCDGRYSA
jgi:hypothetical protein